MKLDDADKQLLQDTLAHIARRMSGLNCRVREVRSELPEEAEGLKVDRLTLTGRADLLKHEIDPMVDEWLTTLHGKHYLIVFEPTLPHDNRAYFRLRNIAVQGDMTWDEAARAARITADFFVHQMPRL